MDPEEVGIVGVPILLRGSCAGVPATGQFVRYVTPYLDVDLSAVRCREMDVVMPMMPSTGFGIPHIVAFAAPVRDATSIEEVAEGGLAVATPPDPAARHAEMGRSEVAEDRPHGLPGIAGAKEFIHSPARPVHS